MTTALASGDWRKEIHCFSDTEGQLFTVTNVPPSIRLSTNPSATPDESLTHREVRSTTRIAWKEVPELAYVLRGSTASDPLLSRLWVQDLRRALHKYHDGLWALSPEILHAWTRLEKGLLYISDTLMFDANNPARMAISPFPNWREPNDFAYRSGCPIPEKAYGRVLRARDAFMLLAARCSLAISLYLPDPQSTPRDAVPGWIQCLQRNGVPQCWIDMLQQSIIADFSPGIRVGAIIDPSYCAWPGLIDTMRRANIPLFFRWLSGPDGIHAQCQQYPLLKAFRPTSSDAWQAAQARPMKFRIPHLTAHGSNNRTSELTVLYSYRLWKDGKERLHPTPPDNQERMPFGPFQFPGESREEFLDRMDRKADALRQVDTPESITERNARIQAVEARQFPLEGSRVYLWLKVVQVRPDVREEWAELDYRTVVPSDALLGVWLSHPAPYRRYNAFLNEWDIWESPEQQTDEEEPSLHAPEEPSHRPRTAAFDPSADAHSACKAQEACQAMEEDLRARTAHRPAPLVSQNVEEGPVFTESYWKDWYGIDLSDMMVFSPQVNHAKYNNSNLAVYFGQQSENMPHDSLQRMGLAAYASAVLDRPEDAKSRIAGTDLWYWDLNPKSPSFLPWKRPCPFSSVYQHTALNPNNRSHPAFVLRYHHDPDRSSQPWNLMVDSIALLFLWRQGDVQDSQSAICSLLGAGVAFRTVRTVSLTSFQQSHTQRRSAPIPCRPLTYRPTTQDYNDYISRVLDLLHQPHARAALMRGGITWRLVMELMVTHRRLWDIFVEVITAGPSSDPAYHQAVTIPSEDGYVEVDDELLTEELDIISGVYKVYTGQGVQTEDASWWPKHSYWVRSGMFTGFWTPWNEVWFGTHMQKVRDGRQGTWNSQTWNKKLEQRFLAKEMADSLSSLCVEWLKDQLSV